MTTIMLFVTYIYLKSSRQTSTTKNVAILVKHFNLFQALQTRVRFSITVKTVIEPHHHIAEL